MAHVIILPHDELVQLRTVDNIKITEIARRYGTSVRTVSRYLRKYGMSRPAKQYILNIDDNKIIDLYCNKRMSCQDIASRVGCSHYTVRYRLLKNHIKCRNRSEGAVLSLWKRWPKIVATPRKKFYSQYYYCPHCNRAIRHGEEKLSKTGGRIVCPFDGALLRANSHNKGDHDRHRRLYPNGPEVPKWACNSKLYMQVSHTMAQ